MKLRWKPFLVICGMVAAFSGMVASCGPERPFCPYGTDPEFICLPDAGSSAGGEWRLGPDRPVRRRRAVRLQRRRAVHPLRHLTAARAPLDRVASRVR